MSPFEYVIVMISIILGLGITTILTGVAEMIKRTPLTSLFAPYIIWIALIFLLHIHEWFLSYDLKTVQVWTLHKFIFFLLYPINLYIVAHLLFPTGPQRESTSREFYFYNYPKLFIGAIILVIQSIVHNLTVSSHHIHTQVPQLIALVILSTMVTTKTKNVVIHVVVSILLLVVALVSLVVDDRKVY